MINTMLDIIRLLNDGSIVPMQKDEDTKIDLYNEKVQLFVDAYGEKSKYYYFSEFEKDDADQDNLAEIEDVALNSDAYAVIEKPTPSDSYMILFWKVGGIEERLYPDIIKIEENEFFYKKYVFYYTEKELQCFKKWCSSLKTNGKPMLDTVLEEVQLLKDESEQVQFLTRLLSKVPFFNPIFPKAIMNDFGEMVRQKIDGIRKQKKNVEMINDIDAGHINMVVVKDLSRFGRVAAGIDDYIEEYFQIKGIRFIAVNENLDSKTSANFQDDVKIRAFFNEWFLRDCSKKTRDGKHSKAVDGMVMATYPKYRIHERSCKQKSLYTK